VEPPIQRRLQCTSSSTDSITSGSGGFSGEVEAFERGEERLFGRKREGESNE
jgi:hypothetical protein